MKKSIIIGAVSFLLILLGGISYIAWQNLRGAGAAWKSSSVNMGTFSDIYLGTNKQGGVPLNAPEGFTISLFAKNLGDPRVMALDPQGTLLVSIPSQGKVVAVVDKDNDGTADETALVAEHLNYPHGLVLHCVNTCKLYIAETSMINEYVYDSTTHRANKKRKIVDIPSGGRHKTVTLTLAPPPFENKLFASVGSSCDVCYEDNEKRGSILLVDVMSGKTEVYAKGLRNSVFMALHPSTGKLWATEMGRDQLGDNLPPDEVNIIEQGKHYGWPVCYGKNMHDTKFDSKRYIKDPCTPTSYMPSHVDIPAHSAPLGLSFIPEEGWPESYRHHLFVAYHGSWNRSEPTGYKVVKYALDSKGNLQQGGQSEDFITGWLDKDIISWGRPVDILTLPGGVMYISDDKAGFIYRVSYHGASKERRFSEYINIDSPREGSVIKSPLTISGTATGRWFFEAEFSAQLLDEQKNQIGLAIIRSQKDWMTDQFIPFKGTMTFKGRPGSKATLILSPANPKGDPLRPEDEIRIPVILGEENISKTMPECKVGGCSGQLCTDTVTFTTCEYTAEYACYKSATCARQIDGKCGWTTTAALTSCLNKARSEN